LVNMFLSLVLLVLVVLGDNNCTFTYQSADGVKHVIDLSPLKGMEVQGSDSKEITYQYLVGVCDNMETECEDIMTGQDAHGAVYQFGGEPGGIPVCWDVLALWDGTHTVAATHNGFSLSWQNGDECRGALRKTVVNFICDASAQTPTVSGKQDESDQCRYHIDYTTAYACDNSPTPKPTPTPPHPGDWSVNGTFTGDLTCLHADDCGFEALQLRGDCEDMKLVTVKGNVYEVFDIEFNECSGYRAEGVSTSIDGSMEFEFSFDYRGNNDRYEQTFFNKDFPYNAMFSIEWQRVSDDY